MFAGEADYQALRSMLADTYAISGHPSYCTVGELDWWRCLAEPAGMSAVRLWSNSDGDVVGFAWPTADDAEIIVHPHHRDIEDAMFAWAEDRVCSMSSSDNTMIEVQAFESDQSRTELLARRGYVQGDLSYVFRLRNLAEPIDAVSICADYHVRSLTGERDIDRRVEVHRSAFHPSRMTKSKYRAVMRSPTYRLDLDLVAEHCYGEFAAFCIVWFDEANKLGVFEPVGCHSEHRRRGLARAVMTRGLEDLKKLGAKTAIVGSHHDNVASNHLYESLGFCDPQRIRCWTKLLDER